MKGELLYPMGISLMIATSLVLSTMSLSGVLATSTGCDENAPGPDTLIGDGQAWDLASYTSIGYFNNEKCRWNTVCQDPTDHYALEVKGKTADENDYLAVYEDETKSVLLDKFYGDIDTKKIYTGRSRVYVEFVSDFSKAARGFDVLNYKCLAHPCSFSGKAQWQKTMAADESLDVVADYLNEDCDLEISCGAPRALLSIAGTAPAYSRKPPGALVESMVPGLQVFPGSRLEPNIAPLPYGRWSLLPATTIFVLFNSSVDSLKISFYCETSVEPTVFSAVSEDNACRGALPPPMFDLSSKPSGLSIDWRPPHTMAFHPSTNGMLFNSLRCNWNMQCSSDKYLGVNISDESLKLGPLPAGDGQYTINGGNGWEIKSTYTSGMFNFSFATFGFTTTQIDDRQHRSNGQHADKHKLYGYYNKAFASRSSFEAGCFDLQCHYNEVNRTLLGLTDSHHVVGGGWMGDQCEEILQCKNSSHWIIFEEWETSGGSNWPGRYLDLYNASGHKIDVIIGSSYSNHQGPYYLRSYPPQHIRQQMNFKCVLPLCKASEWEEFRTNTGVVKVPVDSDDMYYNNIKCQYRFYCPGGLGWYIAMRGETWTTEKNDSVTFFSSTTGAELSSFYGRNDTHTDPKKWTTIPFRRFFDDSSVFATFATDGDSKTTWGVPGGIHWECYRTKCSSNVTGTALIQAGGGAKEFGNNYPGETCSWDLECTNPNHVIFFETFYLSQTGLDQGDLELERERLIFTDRNGTRVWINPQRYYATRHNFLSLTYASLGIGRLIAKFHCRDVVGEIESKCPSTGGPVVAERDKKGSLAIPMFNNKYYYNNLSCSFLLECPVGMYVGITDGSLSVATTPTMDVAKKQGDYLAFYTDGVEDPANLWWSFSSRYKQLRYMSRTNKFLVKFNTDDTNWDEHHPLHEFQFGCFMDTCHKNQSGVQQLFATAGVDEVISPPLLEENCTFRLKCNEPAHWVSFRSVLYLSGSEVFMNLTDDSPVPIPLGQPRDDYLLSFDPVLLSWFPDKNRASGFRALWSCVPAAAFTDSACVVGRTSVETVYKKNLSITMSPFDTYYNDLDCNWNIQCPTDWKIALSTVMQTYGSSDYLLVSNIDGSNAVKWNGDVKIHGGDKKASPLDPNYYARPEFFNKKFAFIFHQNTLKLRFISDPSDTARGFMSPLHYGCLPPSTNCSSNSSDAIVISQPENATDPKSFGNTFQYESCTWKIGCDNKRQWMVFIEMENGGTDKISNFDPEDDPMPLIPVSTWIPMSSFFVRYVAPLDSPNSFKATYECKFPDDTSACAFGRVKILDYYSATISVPRIPNDKYGSLLDCNWKVECPAPPNGSSPYSSILMQGTVLTYDSMDNLTIYNANREVQGVHHTLTPASYIPESFIYIVQGTHAFLQFQSDEFFSALKGIQSFNYLCRNSTCHTDPALTEFTHDGQDETPAINVTTIWDGELCHWDLKCLATHCFQIVDLQPIEYLKAAGAPDPEALQIINIATGKNITYESIDFTAQPVTQLRFTYTSRIRNERMWISYRCQERNSLGERCNRADDVFVNRLWFTGTPQQTETKSVPPSISVSESVTPVDTLSASRSKLTPSTSDTHSRSQTASLTRTESAKTGSETLTLPYTATETGGTFTMTSTDTLSLEDSPSESLNVTESMSFSLSDTSIPVIQASVVENARIPMRAVRGDDRLSTRVTVFIRGSNIDPTISSKNLSRSIWRDTELSSRPTKDIPRQDKTELEKLILERRAVLRNEELARRAKEEKEAEAGLARGEGKTASTLSPLTSDYARSDVNEDDLAQKRLELEKPSFSVGYHGEYYLEPYGWDRYQDQGLWQEDLAVVEWNITHFTFEIGRKRDYYIEHDETVTMRLPLSIFTSRLQEPRVAAFSFEIYDDSPTARDVSATETAGTVAATISGFLAGGAAASQAGKITLIMALAECKFPVDEPLDWVQYPVGEPFLDGKFRYYIGATLFNPVLLVGMVILHVLVGGVFAWYRKISFVEGLKFVYCPSIIIIPLYFLMQDTISATVVVLWHDRRQNPIMVSSFLLVGFWVPLFIGTVRFLVINRKGFLSWYEPAPDRGVYSRFFLGPGDWVDSLLNPTESYLFTRMWGNLFMQYREDRIWWPIFEMTTIVALAVVGAVQPPQEDCRLLLWITVGIFGFYTWVLFLSNPFSAMYEQIFILLISAAQLAALVVFAVAADQEDFERTEGLKITGSKIMAGVGIGLIVKLGIDLLLFAQVLYSDWKDGKRKLQRKEAIDHALKENEKQEALLDADDSMLPEDVVREMLTRTNADTLAPAASTTKSSSSSSTLRHREEEPRSHNHHRGRHTSSHRHYAKARDQLKSNPLGKEEDDGNLGDHGQEPTYSSSVLNSLPSRRSKHQYRSRRHGSTRRDVNDNDYEPPLDFERDSFTAPSDRMPVREQGRPHHRRAHRKRHAGDRSDDDLIYDSDL